MAYHLKIDKLNAKQKEIVGAIWNTPPEITKYHIIRASRQSGKSFMLVRLALMFAMQAPNQRGGFVSASYVQFEKVFKDILRVAGKNVDTGDKRREKPEGLIFSNKKGVNTITFINGSTIQFFTAKNYNAIVGNTFDFLLADEVAIYPNGALEIITPTLAAKREAKAIIASTPRGKNDFYTYCMRGMDDSQTFYKHYRMMYTDNEYYDIREVEEKKKIMPESIFRTEYLGEFVFGQGNVFGSFSKWQTVTAWEEPIQGNQYYGGIDWAGSGADSTQLCIMDAEGKVVFFYEPITENIPEQCNEMLPYIKKYKPLIYSECNGLGLGATEILQTKVDGIVKYWMTNTTKNDIVSTFLLNANNGGIQLPSIDLHPKLDTEMCAFAVSRTPTGNLAYSHSLGFHDDAVDALLIANYARNKMAYLGGNIFDTDNIMPEEEPTDNAHTGWGMKSMMELKQGTSYVDVLYNE